MDLKFSVLISVYYKENPFFLSQAIKSIWNEQTIKPTQIILICDGFLGEALDNQIELLKEKISVLEVYGYNDNKGLGYALNFGLEKCSNELVFRMDADDICVSNRFELQLNYLKLENIVIVGSDIKEFDQKPGDLSQFRVVPKTNKEIALQKNKKNPFNHMTVGFKKSLIQSVGGYKDMPGYEDYYLWLRVLKYYKGMNIDEYLVHARVGNNMIERRVGWEFFNKEIRFQRALRKARLINNLEFARNFILRCLPRCLPPFLLKTIYKFYLRK